MTQMGINLPRVHILETDISIPRPSVNVEILVITAGGRGQDRANSNDNNAFFIYFLYKYCLFECCSNQRPIYFIAYG